MVENVSLEPSRKIVLNLGLVYDTSSDQMEKAMELLKAIGTQHPLTEENVLVGFNDFGASALGLIFIYYIKKDADILITQSEINLEIKRKFEENGLEMAFPTQTIYTRKA
jgi:MscS family membrane protein